MSNLKEHKYDIFISYRREGSYETAKLLAERLKAEGYNVFFDIESLKSGKFNTQLYSVIEQCRDFILVLPENGLDRCFDKNDWLRLEILHALENNKNIIPVLLRGFEYPSSYPEGIGDLSAYQAVKANSFEYFDAAYDRIKSYLKSKKRIKWLIYFLIVASIVILSFSIIFIFKYQEKRNLIRICQSEVLKAGGEFGKMNIILRQLDDTQEEWIKYNTALKTASPKDTADIRKTFISYLDHRLNTLLQPDTLLTISQETIDLLNKHEITSEDLIAFYHTINATFFRQSEGQLLNLKALAKMPCVDKNIYENTIINDEITHLYAKALYVGYLGLLTTMPEEIYGKDFYTMHKDLGIFAEFPLRKTRDEYNADQEILFRKMESQMDKMEKNVAIEKGRVEGINDTN
jgi:hypothetical protein